MYVCLCQNKFQYVMSCSLLLWNVYRAWDEREASLYSQLRDLIPADAKLMVLFPF